MKKKQTIIITTLAIALFAFVLLYSTTDGIGITCDEAWINDSAAHSFAEWMSISANGIIRGDLTTFRSKDTIEKYFGGHFHYHPPFGRMMHAFSLILFGSITGEIKALRMSPEIMFSIICALVFLISLRFTDYTSSLVASLGLLFMPRMFGQAHIFALDMPMTFMWLITVFFFIKNEDSRIYKYLFAISLGLSFCTKAHSALIPVSILLWLIFFPSRKKFWLLVNGTVGALAIFFLTNPWLWTNYYSHFQEFFFGMSSHTEDFVVQTYYLGTKYDSNALPWHYPFVISFFIMPVPILLLIFIGMAESLKTFLTHISNVFSKRNKITGEKYTVFFLINALISLIVISAGFAPSYDGERLFMPAFPFFAILSGFGFYKLKYLCFRNKTSIKSFILAGIIIISSAFSLYSIHPFELSYYNFLAGGLKGAKSLGLEITYWGDALNRNALSFMNKKLNGKRVAGRALFNSILFDYYHQHGHLSKDILYDEDNFDYLLINHREGLLGVEERFYNEQVMPVFSNLHNNVPLLSIYKNINNVKHDDFILAENQKTYWIDTSITYESDGIGKDKIKLNGEYWFPLINLSTAETSTYSSIKISSLFRASKGDYYDFYIFGKGRFNIKMDRRLILENNSSDARYLKESVKLEKGYHLFEGVYKPSDKGETFFAVLAGYVNNEDLSP